MGFRVRVIDWEQPANNDFLLVSQFSVTGALYTCRPDLVGFVNGLPLVVIGLKKPGVPARAAFDENLTHYKAEIPQLFWFNSSTGNPNPKVLERVAGRHRSSSQPRRLTPASERGADFQPRLQPWAGLISPVVAPDSHHEAGAATHIADGADEIGPG